MRESLLPLLKLQARENVLFFSVFAPITMIFKSFKKHKKSHFGSRNGTIVTVKSAARSSCP